MACFLLTAMLESVGNVLEKRWCSFIRAKEKSPKTLTVSGLFGPSVEIRTRGLLNPIQARYQTSPHPDILAVSNSLLIIPQFFFFFNPQFQIFRKKVAVLFVDKACAAW